MNFFKKFLLYSVLFTLYTLYSQDINNKEEIISTSDIPVQQEEVIIQEHNNLTHWQNHLQSLLVKGAFWDDASNTPTNDWLDKAFTLAESVLIQDLSLADELKNSFFTTINEKYTIIEEGKDLKSIFEIINNFNDKINNLVTTLSQKEAKNIIDESIIETEKNLPEEQIQEEIVSEPEEKIEEISQEDQDFLEQEKKRSKQQSQWQESLENIKNEGTEKKEVEGIIEEATMIAQELLRSLPDELQREQADILKKEFEEAVYARSGNVYPINSIMVIATFNNNLNTIVQKQNIPIPEIPQKLTTQFERSILEQEKFIPQKNGRPQDIQQQNIPKKFPIKTEISPVEKEPIVSQPKPTIMTSYVIPQTSLQIEMEQKAKREELKKMKETQELLAKKIQMTALQKAAEEKAAAEKGVISAIMEGVFGTWWTGDTGKKTSAELRKEQEILIEQMIYNKFDRNIREQIKTAYHMFQEALLTFDKKNLPSEKWINTIKESSKILIKYDVMNLDTITNMLKNILQTNTKMTVKNYNDFMNTFITELANYTVQVQKEKEEMQRQAEIERKRKEQELIDREIREQQRIVLEEQQKKDALIQQEKAQIAFFTQFNELKQEWEQLLLKIARTKPASNTLNASFTKKALQITKDLMLLLPQVQLQSKQSIIEKHIADFSNALIAQQKNNEEHINVHHYIESFDIQIHTL